jgi:hypothetical protein
MFGLGTTELVFIVLFILFAYLYFIPSIIAFRNSKNNRFVILLINIFFGGTGLGWLVALALALSGNEEKSKKSRKLKK